MANKRVLNIFFEGLKIYCLNLHKFLLYMAFPVLGQVLGIFILFGINYWFTQNIHHLGLKYPALNNISTILLLIAVCSIPGFIILLKAFWEYLIAYGSINSMTEGYLNTGRVYDFNSHRKSVLNKTFSFISLWFLFGIYTLLAVIPIFWVLGLIFFIYFILIFQVFTFENGLSPVGYFKRSFEIIKGKFARTFLLMAILFVFTLCLLPSGLSVIFDYLNWTAPITKTLEAWTFTLPLEPVEKFGVTPSLISSPIVQQLIFLIVAGFTLPLRSICWTLWYNNLAEPISKEQPKKKSSKKTVSAKKTTKSFKIEKREIDPEIIRRARLEDDEY